MLDPEGQYVKVVEMKETTMQQKYQQIKKRLIKTLTERKLTREWLDRVANQSSNIIENGEILLTYN